jgi:hypothetical protein
MHPVCHASNAYVSLLMCVLIFLCCPQVGTLIAAGCMSGLLFAMGVYSPGRYEADALVNMRGVMLDTTNSTLKGLNAFAAAQTPPNATLEALVAGQNKTLIGLGNPSSKWVMPEGVIKSFQNATKLQASVLQG